MNPYSLEQWKDWFAARGLTWLDRARWTLAAPQPPWAEGAYYRANAAEFAALAEGYGADAEAARLAPVLPQDLGPDLGWGLFAGADLPAGAWIGAYTGRIQAASDIRDLDRVSGHYLTDYAWNFPDEGPGGLELEINALHEGNALRLVNHSFRPNCAVDHFLWAGEWVTFFRTEAALKAGTQLTVDYGDDYWATERRVLVLL